MARNESKKDRDRRLEKEQDRKNKEKDRGKTSDDFQLKDRFEIEKGRAKKSGIDPPQIIAGDIVTAEEAFALRQAEAKRVGTLAGKQAEESKIAGAKAAITADPNSFGLGLKPEPVPEQVAQQADSTRIFPEPKPTEEQSGAERFARELGRGFGLTPLDELPEGELPIAAGQLGGGFLGKGGKLPKLSGWKVGGKTVTDPVKAAKAGTSAKHSKKIGTLVKKFASNPWAALIAGGGIATGIASFFNKRVDDQQQALNTLGQITSTVVGDSTSAAGDYKKGIVELNNLKTSVLQLERDMKSGSIEQAELKFNGQIIDINADTFDQLSTIDEGIRDLVSFGLQGQFPEFSEFELQSLLRELEDEGVIEPVDLTQSRRNTSGEELKGII